MTYYFDSSRNRFDKLYIGNSQEFLDHFDSAITELKRNNVDLSVITIFTPDPIKLREQLKSHPKVKCRGRWLYYEGSYIRIKNPRCYDTSVLENINVEPINNKKMNPDLVKTLCSKPMYDENNPIKIIDNKGLWRRIIQKGEFKNE